MKTKHNKIFSFLLPSDHSGNAEEDEGELMEGGTMVVIECDDGTEDGAEASFEVTDDDIDVQ